MPKQRLVVGGSGLRPVQRQPSVRVRDDYVAGAAARGASADLEQVARAFGQIAPSLGNLAVNLQEKKRQEGLEAGRARFEELAQSQEDFGEAMRLGLVEAKNNPFFRAGMLESAGRIAADRYGDALRGAAGAIEDRSDIAAFDQVQQATFEAAMEEFGVSARGELFQRAFQHRASALSTAQRTAFSEGVSAAMLMQRADLLFEEMSSTLSEALANGLSVEDIAREGTRLSDEAFGQGMKGEIVNPIIAEVFATQAMGLAENDPHAAQRLLEAARLVEAGNRDSDRRPLLANTRRGAAILREAESAVSRIEQNSYRFRAFQEEQERAEISREIANDMMLQYFEAEDVDDVDIEPLLLRATQNGDFRLVANIQAIRESYREARWYTDQEKLAEAQIAIWAPGSAFDVLNVSDMLARKEVTIADARALESEIMNRDRFLASASGDNPLNDPYFGQFSDGDFTREFRDKFGFQGGELGRLANLAMNGFRTDYLRAVESGRWAEMNGSQKNEFLQELFRTHVDLRGGGRSTIESMTEEGSLAPAASIHNREVDWSETLVFTRQEIMRFHSTPWDELEDSERELIRYMVRGLQRDIGPMLQAQWSLIQNLNTTESE